MGEATVHPRCVCPCRPVPGRGTRRIREGGETGGGNCNPDRGWGYCHAGKAAHGGVVETIANWHLGGWPWIRRGRRKAGTDTQCPNWGRGRGGEWVQGAFPTEAIVAISGTVHHESHHVRGAEASWRGGQGAGDHATDGGVAGHRCGGRPCTSPGDPGPVEEVRP